MAHRGKRSDAGVTPGPRVPERATPEPQSLTPRQLMAKGTVATGVAIDESTALRALDNEARMWSENGAVAAPYDPETLLRFVELCPHLGPNLDSYAQNIDGFGYSSTPLYRWMEDLDSDEAIEAVEAAIDYEQWIDEQELEAEQRSEKASVRVGKPFVQAPVGAQPPPPPAPPPPSPLSSLGLPSGAAADGVTVQPLTVAPTPAEPAIAPEVRATIEAIRTKMRREQFRFDSWFKNCCSDMSFTELRRRVRWDKEATGWGCIEMIRDHYGRLMRLAYVPGYTVRPLVNEGEVVEVVESNAATVLSEQREVRVMRRFRRYVQVVGAKKVYFKSPGDPRVISKTTGNIYDTVEDMRKSDQEADDAQPANEILFMAHHWPSTPCSPPRWIPALLSVLGSREAAETNYYHLKNKTMAGGILFVFGGTVKQGVKDRLENRIQQELTGSMNTSKILVVEAMPVKGGPNERSMVPQMQFQGLRDAHTTDGMFLQYDTAAADTIGATFRQSPLLRGYTPSNLNRATAETVVRFSEQQVYEPERTEFDHLMNRVVLPELDIRYLQFKSNSPPTRSAEEVGAYVSQVAPHGGILPAQIQRLSADVLNLPYEQVLDDWTKQPLQMTLAGIVPAGAKPNPIDGEATLPVGVSLAARVSELEKQLSGILTDEMRSLGLDYKVMARLYDMPDTDDTGGGK